MIQHAGVKIAGAVAMLGGAGAGVMSAPGVIASLNGDSKDAGSAASSAAGSANTWNNVAGGAAAAAVVHGSVPMVHVGPASRVAGPVGLAAAALAGAALLVGRSQSADAQKDTVAPPEGTATRPGHADPSLPGAKDPAPEGHTLPGAKDPAPEGHTLPGAKDPAPEGQTLPMPAVSGPQKGEAMPMPAVPGPQKGEAMPMPSVGD